MISLATGVNLARSRVDRLESMSIVLAVAEAGSLTRNSKRVRAVKEQCEDAQSD